MVEQYRANTRFFDVLQHWLNRLLQGYVGKDMNRDTLLEIYEKLDTNVNELFSKTSQNFSDVTKAWLAQQLYLSIKIGKPSPIFVDPNQQVTMSLPQIFDLVDVKKIPMDELRMMAALISDCDFVDTLIQEINRRT